MIDKFCKVVMPALFAVAMAVPVFGILSYILRSELCAWGIIHEVCK